MKKVLLPLMTLLLVLGMLVPAPAMAKINWDFEGWRVDAAKWMDGKLFTWYEGDWVPFRLCARGYDGTLPGIGIQHDYMDARGDYGVDGAGNFFIGPKTPRRTPPGSISPIGPEYVDGGGIFVSKADVLFFLVEVIISGSVELRAIGVDYHIPGGFSW